MKALRVVLLSFIVVLFSMIWPTAEAIEITHLNDSFVKKLQGDFRNSKLPKFEKLAGKSTWTCQLYGMRSRLQTTKKSGFLQLEWQSNQVVNNGSHVVKNYLLASSGLKGNIGPLKDEVRMTDDGRLIGEMVLPYRSQEIYNQSNSVESIAYPKHDVIAYSVCN